MQKNLKHPQHQQKPRRRQQQQQLLLCGGCRPAGAALQTGCAAACLRRLQRRQLLLLLLGRLLAAACVGHGCSMTAVRGCSRSCRQKTERGTMIRTRGQLSSADSKKKQAQFGKSAESVWLQHTISAASCVAE